MRTKDTIKRSYLQGILNFQEAVEVLMRDFEMTSESAEEFLND